MILNKILDKQKQYFHAILSCEHCQSTQTITYAHDDYHFYNNELPYILCFYCRKRSKELPFGLKDPLFHGGNLYSIGRLDE